MRSFPKRREHKIESGHEDDPIRRPPDVFETHSVFEVGPEAEPATHAPSVEVVDVDRAEAGLQRRVHVGRVDTQHAAFSGRPLRFHWMAPLPKARVRV